MFIEKNDLDVSCDDVPINFFNYGHYFIEYTPGSGWFICISRVPAPFFYSTPDDSAYAFLGKDGNTYYGANSNGNIGIFDSLESALSVLQNWCEMHPLLIEDAEESDRPDNQE